jgi:hypothetical protein
MEEIQKYTQQLIKELGVEQSPHPDENRIYTFIFGDGLAIRYNDLNPGLYLMSVLGTLPEDNRENFLMVLMHNNLLGMGTGGGVIGYDVGSKELTFAFAVPYRVSYREFRESIEDFANYVDFWKGELEKIKQGQTSILTR